MIKIGVIFGGRSGEHDISLMSAASILRNLDVEKYDAVPIGVDRDGTWYLAEKDIDKIENCSWRENAIPFEPSKLKETVDFVFPVIHGTQGEDGTLQGLLEMYDVPYAGCGVLASSICMDKIATKDILSKNAIPMCRYKLVRASELEKNMATIVKEISQEFSGSIFVKPANAGSSLGITKVDDIMDLGKALALAASYDRRILVEEAIDGREIEVGVIGNDIPMVSPPGEITTGADYDYYDFEAKYSDSSGTRLDIPADIHDEVAARIREIAMRAYLATDCAGFARVDFFVENETREVLLNEINTIPGLTKYSLFPLMWESAGIAFPELIDRIVEYGYERYNDKNSRQTLRRR